SPDANTIGEAYLSYFEKFDNKLMYLDSASKYLKTLNGFSPRHYFNNKIRLYFLQRNYPALIHLANTQKSDFAKDDWTYYRIGEAYVNVKNYPKALEYFKLATSLSPYRLDILIKQAGAENTLGNIQAAQSIY